MSKKVLALAVSAILIIAIFFFYFDNSKTVDTDKAITDIDSQLRNNVIDIEKNMALTHVMKMSYDELVNKTEPYIHSYYKETYFSGLKKAYETRNLIAYIKDEGPPYYQYISKVYTSDDNSIKQIYVKSTEMSAIELATQMPIPDTKSQVAKQYIFKKDADQWKIFSVNNYLLSISRNEPKRIIEKFTNFNDKPIEYEYMKVLE